MTGIRWTVVAAVTILIIDAGAWIMAAQAHAVYITWGRDYDAYVGQAAVWLQGGPLYHAYQLSGPYDILGIHPEGEALLYPPVTLWLFAPFTVLPSLLYWAVPLAITAWSIRENRLLALALTLYPGVVSSIGAGNPIIWIVAITALATRFPAAAPWILLKPSLAPFAAYRIHHRSWWVGLALFGLACVPFGSLWLDWITAVRNSNGGLLYSFGNVLQLAIPLVGAGLPSLDRIAERPVERVSRFHGHLMRRDRPTAL